MESTDMKSPLNGDNTRIKAKITRKTYNINPDKYGEYVYDPETCDGNEFYEIRTNGVDFILIREKND